MLRRVWLSPWGRLSGVAAAAAVLIAVALLWLFAERTRQPAFAQVIENVQAAASVQMKIFFRVGDQAKAEGAAYIEGDKIRVERKILETDANLISILDLSTGTALMLVPEQKQAQVLVANETANPIDQLKIAKSEDAERIGEEYVDGKLAHVFRIPKGTEGHEVRVWVDPDSERPVKFVEYDANTEQRYEHIVWDQPIDPALFSTEVPDGYTVVDQQDQAPPAISVDEQPAVAPADR